MIGNLVRGAGGVTSLGAAAKELSEVFVPNATAMQSLEHAAHRAALDQLGAEFARKMRGPFDSIVDGLNRLPRPLMALGTLGLFTFAMVSPPAFAARMEGLAYVPEPLWWLLGAIVSFYFGARELHYLRRPEPAAPGAHSTTVSAWAPPAGAMDPEARAVAASQATTPRVAEVLVHAAPVERAADATDNPALAEWLASRTTT
ncbi:holin family protein [Jannaschia sp. 2305UL9-9]|uniref:holin family protein n=1 Tax=Jannaschia sp. 2305UL9-9 TaxID=3121638 RepID=UPI003527516F